MQNITAQWLFSLRHYCSMALLLSSPQRLPQNPYCIALTIVTYYLICLLLIDAQRNYAELSAHLTLELALLALLVHLGLRWKKRPQRFQQTFSALIGINMLITLVTILVVHFVADTERLTENPIFYLILIWNLAALSLVFKRAFEVSVFLSAMIAFNYYVVYQFILVWFYQ